MNSITGIAWPNSNSNRNYPFMDSTNLSIESGGFIPNDFIVDARIYIRNTYNASSTPHVSKITVGLDKTDFTLACDGVELGIAEFPYALALEQQPNENKGIYLGANGIDLMAICPIRQNNKLAGNFVINLKALTTIQALNQGVYSFNSSQLRFVPSVCEYLPSPQVVSINGVSGDVILRGESGIRVERQNETDIKISIVGDPHFTRYNCPEDAQNPIDNVSTLFLEQLTVVHHTSSSSTSPIAKSTLQVMNNQYYKDGAINFNLDTGGTSSLPLQQRPAFRFNVQGNTITLSMAGA
jgi:hypothetical protein